MAPKVQDAYNLLKNMISKTSDFKRIDFYQRTDTGIIPITEKGKHLSTTYTPQPNLYVNPNNLEDLQIKVLSMIFWMIMEPNIIPVLKLPNETFF